MATNNTRTSSDKLSGAEHFLIGISPQYWSHTPMSIASLHQLGLVDGIDCIVSKSSDLLPTRFIPVTKCELVGVIVNADCKSNGSLHFLLDDGTGVVDCLLWQDNGMYSLPSLVPNDDNVKFQVGDLVQVFGKIKCVSIRGVREVIKEHGREWKVHESVREVHISVIKHVSLNAQSNHWLRCIQFSQRCSIDAEFSTRDLSSTHAKPSSSEDAHYLEQRRLMNEPVRNGPDVLRLLGPEIEQKALQRIDFPAPDDAYGAWRVFGVGCRCKLSYLDELLYCHCQATVVALDPHFTFRDSLLEILLIMERNVGNDQLRFKYKAIVDNVELQQIAMQVIDSDNKESVSFDRLYLQTFAALRKDGIVSLLDSDTDVYLLISRERVLKPYCEMVVSKASNTLLERRVMQNEQPAYLKNVTSARLQYVKKTITDNR